MRKVLIANRGEIAVRVARACADAGIASAAVYAEPDRDAVHVSVADEAYALGGDTPASSYLDVGKVLAAAAAAKADAVHPGYGFLSENPDFAQAVLDAGLVWIGPPPNAIRELGDKVAARAVARRVGAPLLTGTTAPVSGADEVSAFVARHGLPVVIKAAYGGGGRGLKVVRAGDQVRQLYEAAVREAVAAFGHGDCFVERYLDRPRHVETQCLADAAGDVVVVSTRDCSLQRRHQKLVEEAPAPFLTPDQVAGLTAASKDILREVGYVGAGTCEFLVAPDGTVAFLEVNTRLQVEHPVTEEVTGIDLVREQLRIADGQRLGYGDPAVRGHSIEFRVNAEDPGRGFVPAPGRIGRWRPPQGPGVRVDSGVDSGTVIGPAWDSLLAKLIVTGAGREQALQRARRALAEFEVDGVPTTLPFHRAVVMDPAFTQEPFTVYTRWIEESFGGVAAQPDAVPGSGQAERERIVVEVGGKRIEVTVPARSVGVGPTARAGHAVRPRRTVRPTGQPAAKGDALVTPMQGTVVTVAVADGDRVVAGDLIMVAEAMKMEQPLTAHRSGIVVDLAVAPGDSVTAGTVVCRITDG